MTEFLSNEGTLHLLLFFSGVLGLLLILFYSLFYFSNFSFRKESTVGTPDFREPISVVICAKNEMENLRVNLPLILEQDYPEFQVVLVNDCSYDDSGKLLEELEKKYAHLKVVTIQEMEKYSHGKKFALTLGIKAASHEHLVFTDADCVPAGKEWLKLMAQNFSSTKSIVLGYGAYKKEPGFLNQLIRYDTAHAALQYLSFALSGMPYMGVGRNLAYKKSLFFANKGFAKHQHILSGDDDLFVNETATSSNTAVETRPAAFTFSTPKKSFDEWSTQKQRHLSTSSYYRTNHKTALIGYWFSQYLFYGSLLAQVVVQVNWILPISLFLFQLGMHYLIFGKALKRLGEKDLILLMPVFHLIMLAIYPTFTLLGSLGKEKKWK